MRWGKRVLGVVVLVLAAAFLVLSVAGVVGAWVLRSRATAAVAEAGDSAAETLAAADTAVGQFQERVAKVRKAMDAIRRAAGRLAALPPDELPVAAAALRHDHQQVMEYLKPALAVARSLELVAGMLDKGLARWQPIGPGQAEIDRLRSAIHNLMDTAAALDQAKEELLEETPAALGRFAERVRQLDERLNGIETSLRGFHADLDGARSDVADLAEAAPRWFTLGAWAATLVLSWFALSQAGMILHGWSLVRRT